jgi:hypothetical protein
MAPPCMWIYTSLVHLKSLRTNAAAKNGTTHQLIHFAGEGQLDDAYRLDAQADDQDQRPASLQSRPGDCDKCFVRRRIHSHLFTPLYPKHYFYAALSPFVVTTRPRLMTRASLARERLSRGIPPILDRVLRNALAEKARKRLPYHLIDPLDRAGALTRRSWD